jgi:hypothetical protein
MEQKPMTDLPEKYREALYQKRAGFPGPCEKEDFLGLYNSVLIDNIVYLKEGYNLPEECFESQFKLSLMVHAIIKKDYVIKNRYGYDGKI